MRIAVVGGGISGLSAAFRLDEAARRRGQSIELTLFEAESRVGGHAATIRDQGFVVETGPNAFLDRDGEHHALRLAEDAGAAAALVQASPAARRRFIAFGGALRRVPESPPALLGTDLLTFAGRLRVMMEPWAREAPAGVDETVFDFAVRRVGREAAERLVDPAVAGITAGDSRALSVADAFPAMVEMEREHQSLIRAMLARRKLPKPRLLSFDGGLDTLAAAVARRLGDAVRTSARVRGVSRAAGAWRVEIEGEREARVFDRVVLATRSPQTAPLVEALDPELALALAALPTASLALVALAYRRDALARALDGYGYLVARREGLDTLGVVWESSLFAGRAPEGAVLLRVMLGGARHPEVAGLAEAELVERAQREAKGFLGVRAAPVATWVRRFPRAIAQYTVGHAARIAALRARAARHAELELVGTSYDGVSFNAAVAAADRLVARMFKDGGTAEERSSAAFPLTEKALA